MKKIVLLGNGGHSKVIQAMIHRTDGYILAGILDQAIESYYETNNVFYDNTDSLSNYINDYLFVIAIGDNYIRDSIIKRHNLNENNFTSIIDANAIITPDISIGTGTVVMPGVVINPGSTIGKHSIVNTRAVVEHDNTLGDFVHISPNATLAGTVTVKDFVHVGSGATVIPNKTVHQHSVIGAGAVVTEDIDENSVAVGVPAEIVKRR